MRIVNFAHPLTEPQRQQLAAVLGFEPGPETRVPVQLDMEQPFAEQAVALVDKAGLSYDEWQSATPLVVLPALHVAAAAVLAEIEGRAGILPAVLRLKPVPNAPVPQFEMAEIINLYAIRNEARSRRATGRE